ncbi:MAG: hypothetical protein Q9210_004932 [Variospora velana]
MQLDFAPGWTLMTIVEGVRARWHAASLLLLPERAAAQDSIIRDITEDEYPAEEGYYIIRVGPPTSNYAAPGFGPLDAADTTVFRVMRKTKGRPIVTRTPVVCTREDTDDIEQ